MRFASVALPALCLALGACALNGPPVGPLGRPATVRQVDGASLRGELLAASLDTVWLLSGQRLTGFDAAAIREVRVQRHTMGFRNTMTWMGIAGVSSGMLLMVACSNYYAGEGQSSGGTCLPIVPVMTLVFGAGGVVFGALNERSSTYRFKRGEMGRLQPYARYPQGLPDTVRHMAPVPER